MKLQFWKRGKSGNLLSNKEIQLDEIKLIENINSLSIPAREKAVLIHKLQGNTRQEQIRYIQEMYGSSVQAALFDENGKAKTRKG